MTKICRLNIVRKVREINILSKLQRNCIEIFRAYGDDGKDLAKSIQKKYKIIEKSSYNYNYFANNIYLLKLSSYK